MSETTPELAPPLTPKELCDYVNGSLEHETELLTRCVAQAGEIVARLSGVASLDAVVDGKKIPPATLQDALLQTAADQYGRRRARNGIIQLDGAEVIGAAPVRLARDPEAAARAILAPWLGPALA